MEPHERKRLEYASSDTPSPEDERQQRYHREPPDVDDMLGIGVGLLVVLSLVCYWVFRIGF